MSTELIKSLTEARAAVWEKAKTHLDVVEAEGRTETLEADATWSALNADLDTMDKRISELDAIEKRNIDADEVRARYAGTPSPAPVNKTDDATRLRAICTGETRGGVFSDGPSISETRDLSKLTAGAGLNTVKTSFYAKLVEHMIEVSAVLQAGATVLETTTGEKIQVPKTTAHSSAALIAEAATLTESDPAFGQLDLDAYKYGMSVQVSSELVSDTSIDLLGYLARQCGRAVGNAAGADFVTGNGTNKPNGIATAATTGITGSASVAGAFTADNLIDLYHSVIAPYRNSPGCAWLLRDATLGAVRKLKDATSGQFLWQPGLAQSAPDQLLGKPVYTDPNVAAVGLAARSVLFGDLSTYYVRSVKGVRFERSDDFAFQNDLVTFRCIWRADGDLTDLTGSVKAFVGNAA